MKGQLSVEVLILLGIIIIMVVVALSVLFTYISKTNSTIVNESEYYYPSSFNLFLNNGLVTGTIHFSTNFPVNSIVIYFTSTSSNSVLFSIPFVTTNYNTSYGSVSYLIENETTNYSSYENVPLQADYFKYTENSKTYFVTLNRTIVLK